MAIISGTGVFSGIDSAKIIDQLLSVERRPIEILQVKKNDYNAKISKWGNISNLLNNLKSSLFNLKEANIVNITARSSNDNVLTATVSSSASEGNYNIKIKTLASAQSIYSSTYSNPESQVADLSTNTVQKLMIKVGDSEEKIITIDATNNTLTSIKDAINNSGIAIKANIINDGTGYRLVISSINTGSNNKIVIKVDENNDGLFESSPEETDNIGLSSLAFNPVYDSNGDVSGGIANLVQAKKASDVSLEIDGVLVTREKNEISDLISGVTIKLQNVSDNLYLSISKDFSAATKNVNNFVSAYNSLMSALKDESLKDDAISRQIVGSVRNILINTYSGKTLTNFGLSHDKTGVLSLDTNKFETAIEGNFTSVAYVIDSMSAAMENNIKTYLDKIIPEKKQNYTKQIEIIDKRVENIEKKLEKSEADFRKRFYELEKTIASLQRSGDYLTQTLTKWGNNK